MLHDYPDLGCPIRFGDNGRECVWPGELIIDATDRGAVFSQSVTLYKTSRVLLPGDLQHWPVSVSVDSKPAPLIDINGRPALALAAGSYDIQGAFIWSKAPVSLPLSPQVGIMHYSWKGSSVSPPEWHDGALWLRDNSVSNNTTTPDDSLKILVSRRINDGHPLTVITHLQLEVAGSQREVRLGKVIFDGFAPQQLSTNGLPARLDPDSSLRMQVRPGVWQIDITSYRVGRVDQIAFEAQKPPWPDHETWVYQSSPADRITEIEGPSQVDPRRTHLPEAWQHLPAYQLAEGDVLQINTLRRGNPVPEPDQLTLHRELWLDFNGQGYSTRDQLSGELRGTWRLNASAPLALGQVQIDDHAQFITTTASGSDIGVEVRQGQLDLLADARIENNTRTLPASGWSVDFQQVSARIHTPPGWRVLTVTGADNVPDAWLWQWTVYDLFLLLITILAVAKLWRWYWGIVAMLAMALVWHETQLIQISVLGLLASVALLRVVPGYGKLFTVLRVLRLGILLLFAMVLLPFLVDQARLALFPQLERYSADYSLGEARFDQQGKTYSVTKPAAQPQYESRDEAIVIERTSRITQSKVAQTSAPATPKRQQLTDPDAIVQTGQGTPDWSWRITALSWNGPVKRDQQITLYMLGPRTMLVLRFVSIALLLLLAWRLLDVGKGSANPPTVNGSSSARLWFLALFTAYAGTASATQFPPPEILQQLSQRLQEQSLEAPRASIQSMNLKISTDQLDAVLQIHALQETVIPLPIISSSLAPLAISIDNVATPDRLVRDLAGQLWLHAPEGQHRVTIRTFLPPVDQLQLPLPLVPHRVRVEATGWTVQGLDENGVPRGQLSLIRVRNDDDGQSTLTPRSLPAFYSVQRKLTLGLRWQVDTTVERLSRNDTGSAVTLPLLTGESVVSDAFTIKDGQIRITMSATQPRSSWQSFIDPTDSITLTAPQDIHWVEQWQLDIGPMWHVEFDGIAPVFHQDGSRHWLPTWRPWPGESITLRVTRPQGIEGQTKTIDQSALTVTPGKRATDNELSFTLRSSQGGQHQITLPTDAQAQSIRSNNRSLPIRQEGRAVSIAITPGEQHVELLWREDRGISNNWHSPIPELGAAHVNSSLVIKVPDDRWIVWLNGPALGPAVLFWGVVIIMLVVAIALGAASSGSMPIGFLSWLLLGMGLAQVSVLAILPVAIWLFLLHFRSGLTMQIGKTLFNALQLTIVWFTLVAIYILMMAVQNGLLGMPEMQITGNQSYFHTLKWFQDRSTEAYPVATVISVPLLYYRALMLLWALWLAFSLLRWLRWGWNAFSEGGLWASLDWKMNHSAKHVKGESDITHQL